MVVIHRHATNLNPSTLLLRAKKTIGLGHTISEFLLIVSLSHQSLLTILNTLNKMDTLPTHEHISKIHTELHQDLTEMIAPTSRTMAEVVHNIWLSASLHLDKEPQLHADTAGDVRWAKHFYFSCSEKMCYFNFAQITNPNITCSKVM